MSKPSRRTGSTEPIPPSRKNHRSTTYTHVAGSKIPFTSAKRAPVPSAGFSYPNIPSSNRSSPDPIPYPVPNTPSIPAKLWTLSVKDDNSTIQGAIRRNNLRWKNVLREYSNDLREAKKGRKLSEEEREKEKKNMMRERKRWKKITGWLAVLLLGASLLLYYVGTGSLTFYRDDVPDMFSWVAQMPEDVLMGVGVKPREGEKVNWAGKQAEKEEIWKEGSRICGWEKGTGIVRREYCQMARTNYKLALNAIYSGDKSM